MLIVKEASWRTLLQAIARRAAGTRRWSTPRRATASAAILKTQTCRRSCCQQHHSCKWPLRDASKAIQYNTNLALGTTAVTRRNGPRQQGGSGLLRRWATDAIPIYKQQTSVTWSSGRCRSATSYPSKMMGVRMAFSCTCQPNKKKHMAHSVLPSTKLGHVGLRNTATISG